MPTHQITQDRGAAAAHGGRTRYGAPRRLTTETKAVVISAATPPDGRSDPPSGPAARAARAFGCPVDEDARIERLRSLIARLERFPRSGQRDAVLRDVRARVVTLDTGLQTSSAWRSKPLDRPYDPLVELLAH